MVLPSGGEAGGPAGVVVLRPSWFVCPRSGPLLPGGLLVGLASSVFWTFSVDHLVTDGGLSSRPKAASSWPWWESPAWAAASAETPCDGWAGARPSRSPLAVEAAALLLLGLAPVARGRARGLAAAMFGAAYDVVVAVQVIWSGRVYDARPSAGLAATVAMNALGLLLGPPLLGAVADQTGFGAVFAAAGLLLLATVALAPREPLN